VQRFNDMPNHVYQKIRISDWNYTDKAKELAKKLLNEKNEFDFNLLIPQPENTFLGALGEKEREMCFEKKIPNWYDWNQEMWGTKWNAYTTDVLRNEEDTLEFTFQTAWNIPKPIIEKLFNLFKGCEIHYLAVDEGGFFAVEVVQNEEGEQTTKDLKEHYETLLFALS
jgi:hypothetical protein